MDLETKRHITRQERIKFLFMHGTAGAYTSIVGACLIFTMLSLMDRYTNVLLTWAASVIALGVIRVILLKKFLARDYSIKETERQLKWHTLILALAGFCWGLLTLNSGADHTEAALIIPIISLALAATVSLTSVYSCSSVYFTFLAAMSVSAIVGMAATRGIDGLYLAMALLFSAPLLVLSSRRLEQHLVESIWTQHEVHELLDDVNNKNKELKALNSSLQETQDLFDQEEEVARHVFNQLIHSSEDSPDHCKYWMKPMMSFSGDIIQMAHGPENEEYILLGDFTGHGLPAALGAVPTTAIFKTMAHKGLAVHLIAEELNRKLCELLPTGYFCCAAIMKVNSERDSATIWNGGLPDIILTNQKHGLAELIPSDQLPLGIQPTNMNEEDTANIKLNNDDFIYIYSDGVTEVENNGNDMLGSEAFKKIISRPARNNSRLDMIKMAVLSFADGAPASDDISLIEYRCMKNKTASSKPELEATN